MYGITSPLRAWIIQSSTVTLLVSAMSVQALPPAWWLTGDPPVISGTAINNKGMANVGQAKWMAKCAIDALRVIDDPLADSIEADLLHPLGPLAAGWAPPTNQTEIENNRAPLAIGALKNLAAPFYKHLCQHEPEWITSELNQNGLIEGLSYFLDSPSGTYFPWNPADNNNREKNQTIATVGQLKAVFSLRFENLSVVLDSDSDGLTNQQEAILGTSPHDSDSDNDGMPDGWEVEHGLNPLSNSDRDSDPDGDKVSNFREFEIGTNPRDILVGDLDHDGVPDDYEKAFSDWVNFNFKANAPADPLAFDATMDYGDIGLDAASEFIKATPAPSRISPGSALMLTQWAEVEHVGLSAAVAAGDGGGNFHSYPRGWFFKTATFLRDEDYGSAEYHYVRNGYEDLTWLPPAIPVRQSARKHLLNWTPKWHLHGDYTETETPPLAPTAPPTAIKKYETLPGTPGSPTYDVAGLNFASAPSSPAFTIFTPKSGSPYTQALPSPKLVPFVAGGRTMPTSETVPGGSIITSYQDPVPKTFTSANTKGGDDSWTMGSQDDPGKSWRDFAKDAYDYAIGLYGNDPSVGVTSLPFSMQGGVGMGVSRYGGDALGELKARHEKATFSFRGNNRASFALIHKQHCRLPGNSSMATQAQIERLDEYDAKYIPRGLVESFTVEATPAEEYDFVTIEVSKIYLDDAPNELVANRDFDEGDISILSLVHGKGAQEDCMNDTLLAERASVDGRYNAGDLVTEDLYSGHFGAAPSTDSFWNDAEITISKVNLVDTDTGLPEPGQVAFYATWGTDNEEKIENSRIDGGFTPVPVNLVGTLYGSTATLPSHPSVYWIEGVVPGKITLEWHFKKGSIDLKHRQSFEVCNKWSKAEWLSSVRDEMFIDSYEDYGGMKINRFSARGVDIDDLNIATDLFSQREEQVASVYEYYRTLQLDNPDVFLWPGLAKRAGVPIYSALSDLQWNQLGEALPFGVIMSEQAANMQRIVMEGMVAVREDICYQFAAYKAGGMSAIEYLADTGEMSPQVFDGWLLLHDGVSSNLKSDIDGGNMALVRREQEIVLAPTFADVASMRLGWFFAAEWVFSVLGRSVLPGGPNFLDVVPGGDISKFSDRWKWITNPGNGLMPMWSSKTKADRVTISGLPLLDEAEKFSNIDPILPIVR